MKVGQYVKIKKEYSDKNWYVDKILKIINIGKNMNGEELLFVNFNFVIFETGYEDNSIASKYCEIYPMRKKKIINLLKD